MIPFAYNLRSLLVRKATTWAAVLGLALVVFVFASVMMLTNGIAQATRRALDPSSAIVLRSGAAAEIESSIDMAAVARIAAAPGIARAPDGQPLMAAELIVLIILGDRQGSGAVSNVQLRGVPDDVARFRPRVRIVEGRAPRPGTDEAIVGRAIRGRFAGLELGGKLDLTKNRPLEIVGVFEDGGSSYESELWADRPLVQRTFGQEGVVSSVRVRLESAQAFARFKAAVSGDRELGLGVFREREFAERQTQGTANFLGALGFLVASLFALGATLGAMITMHAVIAQRAREIGTLRALGFSRRQVLVSFLLEALLLALAGGVLGAAGSLLLASQRISMINTATWAELSFQFEPSIEIVSTALGIAALMGFAGGLLPALAATRIDPARAMRG